MYKFELEFYEHTATFKQKIKVNSDKAFEITGKLKIKAFHYCN